MKLYIARDKNKSLTLFPLKPRKLEKRGIFIPSYNGPYIGCFPMNKKEYPEVTWENSPQQVEISLIKCENK